MSLADVEWLPEVGKNDRENSHRSLVGDSPKNAGGE